MLDRVITAPLRVTMQIMFSWKNLWQQASTDDDLFWLGDEYDAE